VLPPQVRRSARACRAPQSAPRSARERAARAAGRQRGRRVVCVCSRSRAAHPPPPSLPYKVDTSRPSRRTDWTRLVPSRAASARASARMRWAAGADRLPPLLSDTPCPSPRTNRTRRVPHPVLIGHVSSPSMAAERCSRRRRRRRQTTCCCSRLWCCRIEAPDPGPAPAPAAERALWQRAWERCNG